jgi:hypothetical protein
VKRGFKFVFINILLLFLSLVLSGCLLPHTTEVAPAIKGQIVDESSGKGICGAEITYTIKAENQYSEFAISDKNGNFQTKAPTQWLYIVYLGSPGFYPVPDRLYVIERQLQISKDGYIPKQTVLNRLNENLTDVLDKADFGEIKLSPKAP